MEPESTPLPPPPWERPLPEGVATRGMRIYRDVVYANELGYRPLELDLYLPTDRFTSSALLTTGRADDRFGRPSAHAV
jgi:hypothetical protein